MNGSRPRILDSSSKISSILDSKIKDFLFRNTQNTGSLRGRIAFRKSQVELHSQACKQPTHHRLPPASFGFASEALSIKLGIEKIVADLARAFETALSNCHNLD